MNDDLETLAADLSRAGLLAGFKIRAVLGRSATHIRDDARENAPGGQGSRAKHYPRTITYDVTLGVDGLVAEIGPDRNINGQAKLAHLFEYGKPGQAPRPHLGPALDREVDKFAREIADLGGDVL